MTSDLPNSRRDFLSGQSLRDELARTGERLADELSQQRPSPPVAGPTLRITQRAMATDFSVILNPEESGSLEAAGTALRLVEPLEDQLTVYRPHSEMSQLNQQAATRWVTVEPQLFQLLDLARQLSQQAENCFDPTAGPLIALWRACKAELRLPEPDELQATLAKVGMSHVQFDPATRSIRFDRPGVELNLGSIGKGYALDRIGQLLRELGLQEWLIHGGHSSILGSGNHAGHSGWPLGIRNPLFPEQFLATVLLKDRGLSTSGSGTQHFRLEGRRFGHLLDPRTGWPVEGMLSVTVWAPTAAEADALSTAFFVIGVEKARQYCHNHPQISALLIPPPLHGRRLQPVLCNLPEDEIWFAPDELST